MELSNINNCKENAYRYSTMVWKEENQKRNDVMDEVFFGSQHRLVDG